MIFDLLYDSFLCRCIFFSLQLIALMGIIKKRTDRGHILMEDNFADENKCDSNGQEKLITYLSINR